MVTINRLFYPPPSRFELGVRGIFPVFPGSPRQLDGRRIRWTPGVTEASALAVRPRIVGDISGV